MDTTHPGNRPGGYSTSRYFYFVMTNKTHGICRTCKQPTEWNEHSMKYDQYCKNPECKQAYAKMAKQRMIGKYGQVHLLNNPDMQKKMLENRRISGRYRFEDGTEFGYVGSYEKEFLKMMDRMMCWHTNDIIAPSPHTYYYNYKNPKDKENEGLKFYIPDFYIPSLNLEIEIKQQTSGNKAMNDINRVKESLKDEVMNSNKNVNYLKINDNDFTVFFDFLIKAQEYLPTPENIKNGQMDLVMESFTESYMNREESINNSNDELIEVAQEGLLSFLHPKKEMTVVTPDTWISKFQIKKNLIGGFGQFYGVRIENHTIELHGINFNLLESRIKRYYDDKSINNIFIPKYNALSYKKFVRKKIQRSDIKIDYLTTPEFFALELVNLFTDLGKRYRDKSYLQMAARIYDSSWLSEADRKSESTPLLDTKNLENITLELNTYQKEFIEKYPKLKAQLNLNGYILAFEQGLGKTLTATGLAECLGVDHVYIVCPNSLKENWALELKKYYKKYEDDDLWRQEVFICSDKPVMFHPDTTRFIITNNESIQKMFPYVLSGRNMLVLDESHNFRNLKSKRVGELLELRDKLKCVDTLVMSGTPIKATPDEIVPALMLIDPSFNITAATCFSKAFKLTSSIGTSLVETRFGKIMYRKEKDVLETKLPEKHVNTINVKIANKKKYIMEHVNQVVLTRFGEIYDAGIKDAMKLRTPFMELSKTYSPNPDRYHEFEKLIDLMVKKEEYLHEVDQIFVEDYMKGVSANIPDKEEKNQYTFYIKNFVRYKAHCLGLAFGEILPKYRRDMFVEMYSENRTEFYRMIKENPKKTLIFSQFKGVVNYIYEDLCNVGIGAVCITGDVKDRMPILRSFKEDDAVQVLVATSQTIGTGVTLVEANQMFFFGPPWRQADFDQCSDRIHRIGQTDDVYIYTVILDTGALLNLSTRMDDILIWSKKMTESVINTTKDDADLEQNHFEELLKAEESFNQQDNVLDKIKAFNKELATYEYILVQPDGTIVNNIKSNSFKNYKILSPSDFNKYHGGICWDYVAYEASKFSFCNYKTFFFCLVDKDGNPKHTHTFLLFYLNDKVYWFEASWKSHIGIFEFENEDSALSSIIHTLSIDKPEKDFYIVEYKPSKYIGNTEYEFTTAMAHLPKYKYKIIKEPKKKVIQSFKINHNGKIANETELCIDNVLSSNIVQETYLFSKDDIVLHLDDFVAGKTNILLITGISRSGKTTLAYELAPKYNAEIIQIDFFENYYCKGDEVITPYVLKLRSKWFNTPIGKKYKMICEDDPANLTNEDLTLYMADAVSFIIKCCRIHSLKKFIIEGMQIFSDVNPDLIKQYPLIIKGTSMIQSFARKSIKNTARLKYYIQSEKDLNEFRKSVSMETFITDDVELLNEFLGIEPQEE